ncbi:hypothetical protein LCGC14_2122960 [marine sediment metagenome]|uniref:Uncharacterized protein n=1 Tax=marine sediment metagenome TaxID=412755 RepID=A0A0F9E3Q9_9ZZZZ
MDIKTKLDELYNKAIESDDITEAKNILILAMDYDKKHPWPCYNFECKERKTCIS